MATGEGLPPAATPGQAELDYKNEEVHDTQQKNLETTEGLGIEQGNNVIHGKYITALLKAPSAVTY